MVRPIGWGFGDFKAPEADVDLSGEWMDSKVFSDSTVLRAFRSSASKAGITMATEGEFVTVKAFLPTVPLPPNSERPAITTDRLLLRALQPTDLEALHVLRTQEEVMKWTSARCIDESIEKTKSKLDPFLPPHDLITANFAICLKETGELIGIGGCHLYPGRHGWPEAGYMLRTDAWGKGFATEFLTAWLRFWSELPRSEREVRVDKEMVIGEGVVDGHLIAITEASNSGSQKVLVKCGFERFREFTEVDGTETVNLVAFRFLTKR